MHEDELFSANLLNHFRRIQTAATKEERTQLMLEFADSFAIEHDESDYSANDNFHQYIEEYETAKLAYMQSAMRLARMGMDLIDTLQDENNLEADPVPPRPVDRRAN